MPDIFFLEANVPLTKSYQLDEQGEIKSSSYPNISNFKSHQHSCASLADLHKVLVSHSEAGHCLLKGKLQKTLDWESRAGSTRSEDPTQWVCLDLDGAPFDSPEAFMKQHDTLKDVSYIVQYSASQGLGKPGLRCHIFIYLSGEYNVSYLKSWLMSLNLDGNLWAGTVRRSLTLSNAKVDLHWPIDITTCQNDKLLYIAPPTIGKGVVYTPPKPAIQYVAKKNKTLDIKVLGQQNIEQWKQERRTVLNALRKEQGLTNLRQTKFINEYEVQSKPGEATITEMWVDGEWVRFNFNGGNSNAYYHPLNNFELIHSFKGEPACLTKEILPGYYKDCVALQRKAQTQPTEQGEVILGVCDKRSAALWKISWHEATHNLQLYPARSDKQLSDWLQQHGKVPGDFTPQWTFEFAPHSDVILDTKNQYLNTYVPSKFYLTPSSKTSSLDKCPTIKKIAMSIVSNNQWNEVTEHLMNWLAVIFQKRIKIGTCWVTGGTEGTGKGLFINKVLKPLLGARYVKEITITRLEDPFNGWLEQTLLCFVDEIQVSSSQHRKIISGTLRNWITEPSLDMRNMNMMAYNAPNYTNFFMGSNQGDPVEINDADRRHNIGEFQQDKLKITEHEIDVLIPRELEHFFNYLMTRQADVARAREVIHTKSRRDVIMANRNSLDMLADALLDGDIGPFIESLPDVRLVMEVSGADSARAVAFDTIVRRELQLLLGTRTDTEGIKRAPSRLSRDELFILFDYCIGSMPSSPNKFTRLLKHKRIETKRLRDQGGSLSYGIEVTWVASQAWCDEHTLKPEPLRRVK